MSVSKLRKLYEGLMHVPHCGKYAGKRVLIDLIFPHKGRILDFALYRKVRSLKTRILTHSTQYYLVCFSTN